MEFTGERFLPGVINDFKLEVEHLQRYNSITHLVRDKVVVDAACGEGYGSAILANFARTVYGLDISEDAIREAKEKYNKENLSYINSSIATLPFDDESVDVLVSFETIEHVEEPIQHAFLKEIKRVIKKDGILIMSTPNKYVYSKLAKYENEFHIKEFFEDEFYSFLSSSFSHVKFFHQGFRICSLIEDNSSNLDVILTSPDYKPTGKYIVALCSDQPIKNSKIESIVLETDEQYENLINRIIQLQEEVEERNQHIHKLDEHIGQLDERIKQLDTTIMENNQRFNVTRSQKIKSFLRKL
jgi:O-antigen biosynthesis protein